MLSRFPWFALLLACGFSLPAAASAAEGEMFPPEPVSSTLTPAQQALEAVKLEFSLQGIAATRSEVRAHYQVSCDGGYNPACGVSKSASGVAGNLPVLSGLFASSCSAKDPVACTIAGYAGLSRASTGDEEALRSALVQLNTACQAKVDDACLAIAPTQAVGTQVAVLQRGCTRGHQPSCTALAEKMTLGVVPAKGTADAFKLWNTACQAGDAPACFRYGRSLLQEWDASQALTWFGALCLRGHRQSCALAVAQVSDAPEGPKVAAVSRFACELGEASGCRVVGLMQEITDPKTAVAAYQRACDLGDAGSCDETARMALSSGQSVAELAGALDRACERGSAEACTALVDAWVNDKGVTPDERRGATYIRGACPGTPETAAQGCYAVGRVYETGLHGEEDRGKAADSYGQACLAGNLDGCYRHGSLMVQGRVRDDEAALRTATKACDGGIEPACLLRAQLLATGDPVVRDLEAAITLYEELCDSKDALACVEVGGLYEEAEKAQFGKARTVYEKGIALESPEAKRRLANLLWMGLGGPMQRGLAKRYYKEACRAGNEKACWGPR